MRRPDRGRPVTQSESSYPQGNQLLDVVRTIGLGDRREYRSGIAFPHGKATRAGRVPAFLAACTCRHYHFTSAIRIRTDPMFPFLHHHVSKYLLVCPISMSLPGKSSLCASNVASSDKAFATRSHSDRKAILLKVAAMQGEIQVLLPIGSKPHDRPWPRTSDCILFLETCTVLLFALTKLCNQAKA